MKKNSHQCALNHVTSETHPPPSDISYHNGTCNEKFLILRKHKLVFLLLSFIFIHQSMYIKLFKNARETEIQVRFIAFAASATSCSTQSYEIE